MGTARSGLTANREGLEGVVFDWEYYLAHTRFLLALVCAATAWLHPAFLGSHPAVSRSLFVAYILYSVAILTIAQMGKYPGWAGSLGLEFTEIAIISLIVLCTGGVQSFFVGLYLFLYLAAACKWGFVGALLTSLGCTALLSWRELPQPLPGGISFPAKMSLAAILVSCACLFGLLVQTDRKRYSNVIAISRLLGSIIPAPSFGATVENLLSSVREHFQADLIRLAVQEIGGERAFGWEAMRPIKGQGHRVRCWKLTKAERRASFAFPPGPVQIRLGLNGELAGRSRSTVSATDAFGNHDRSHSRPHDHLDRGRESHGSYELQIVTEVHGPVMGSWPLLASSFLLERTWLGRLTIYNPRAGRNLKADSVLVGVVIREIAPAVYGKWLVESLRSRAQMKERARISQILHDGTLQSLIALEMQIAMVRRRQSASMPGLRSTDDLRELQDVLHNEIANLREEMQKIKPLQVEPSRLLDYLARIVDRFRRESGISATFVTELPQISLSPRVCTDLVRIVQEALANVRKHSGAQKVLVQFAWLNGYYKLCVEDDGRGFGFAGRLSSTALDTSLVCPVVIKERVDAIGGELMIESAQGSGARIQVTIPAQAHD